MNSPLTQSIPSKGRVDEHMCGSNRKELFSLKKTPHLSIKSPTSFLVINKYHRHPSNHKKDGMYNSIQRK